MQAYITIQYLQQDNLFLSSPLILRLALDPFTCSPSMPEDVSAPDAGGTTVGSSSSSSPHSVYWQKTKCDSDGGSRVASLTVTLTVMESSPATEEVRDASEEEDTDDDADTSLKFEEEAGNKPGPMVKERTRPPWPLELLTL